MPFPPSFLDELRHRLPVSQVVGRHVRLVRAGREHKGCCPFHKEKTPSFTINDDKGFFHCFGCGAHGDVVGFAMRHGNLSFPEAVESLAAQAGLTVPAASPQERARFARETSLLTVVEAATRVFERCLAGPEGDDARAYLARRGLDDDTIARFRLGLAPTHSRSLIEALRAEGFDQEALLAAGLARRPDGGRPPYAFFRNRIMFPVTDRRGRVVAFGGRLIDGDGPKYINSPDGPLFHKGRLLYNAARARQAASDGQTVLVAEGYMDVISLVRAGFEAAVAPLGTALTEEQIVELWRLTPEPVLCFDGDQAGARAASRAVDRILPLLRPDHSVRFAWLPSGEDPDSLVRAGGADAMRRVADSAQPLVEMIWQRHLNGRRFDTPEARAGLKSTLGAVAEQIADQGVRGHYQREFRLRLEAAFPWRLAHRPAQRAVQGAPGRWPQQGGRGRSSIKGAVPSGAGLAGPVPSRVPSRDDAAELAGKFLAFLINHPWLLDEVAEQVAMLDITDPELQALLQAVLLRLSSDPDLDSAGLKSQLQDQGFISSLDRILSDRMYTRVPCARDTADPEDVRAGWREQWGRFEQRQTTTSHLR